MEGNMANLMKKRGAGKIQIFIVGIILVGMIVGYYFYLSNRGTVRQEEAPTKMTAVQEALNTDLVRNYPPTPKEVVKLYGKMSQCFYNESYSDEEFVLLADKIRELYDDDLVANQTQSQYIESLKWDVNQMKEQGIVISSYATSASTDVDYFSQDGFEFARLYCSFTLRKGTTIGATNEVFLLRKDDDGHWKIFGFKLAEDPE